METVPSIQNYVMRNEDLILGKLRHEDSNRGSVKSFNSESIASAQDIIKAEEIGKNLRIEIEVNY